MYNTNNIKFPVLLFSSDYKSMEFIEKAQQLDVITELALKKNSTIGSYIIDPYGALYKILDAKKLKNYYPFWKFEFFNPLVYVDLKVEKVQNNVPLLELGAIILKASENYNNKKRGRIKEALEKTENYKDLINKAVSIIDSN